MNKYKQLSNIHQTPKIQEQMKEAPRYSPRQWIAFRGGHQGEQGSIDLPLDTAGYISSLRHLRKGVRRDFGLDNVGSAAPSKIIALGEYKYILYDAISQRTFRVYISGGYGVVEFWNGVAWYIFLTSSVPMQERYLSVSALQNVLMVADGWHIFRFSEIPEKVGADFDFPPGNKLTAVDDYTALTISGIQGIVDETTIIRYRVTFTGSGDVEIELGFYIDDYLEDSVIVDYVAGSDPDPYEVEGFVNIPYAVSNGEEIKIQIDSIDFYDGVVERYNYLNEGDDGPAEFTATKIPGTSYAADGSLGALYHRYTFHYNHTDPLAHNILIYLNPNGHGWELWDTISHGAGEEGPYSYNVVRAGLGPGTKFGMTSLGALGSFDPGYVSWEDGLSSVEAKGFNKLEDEDPDFGVSVNDWLVEARFSPAEGAPAASYIFSFADRLVALQDGSNVQALSWSKGGDVTEWEELDAGQIWLVDARVDSLDDLMSGGPIGSNMAVVIRKRSIMKLFETGNVFQALGATHWIEGIGTESPFSFQIVPGGAMFLGHNLVVYYLTENGPTPVGMPIFDALTERLTSNYHLVDSAYDQVQGEYWMGIPEHGAEIITSVWIFDVKRFLEDQEIVWRKRPEVIQRLGVTSRV